MRSLFRKKLFPNISVVFAILHTVFQVWKSSLIKNQYYLYYKFGLSFSEAVILNYKKLFYLKKALKMLPKFTCNLIVKVTPNGCISVNLANF